MPPPRSVLALNCGSSSVKLALLDPDTGERTVSAVAERVGSNSVAVTVTRNEGSDVTTPDDATHRGVVTHLIDALSDDERATICGVGHRVVHGGARFSDSVVIDDDVIAGIRDVVELAPLQIRGNLAGIEASRSAMPEIADVAVFDTAFHRTLPPVAYRYAIPDAWYTEHGVRRYGFHGISHRYVSSRAAELLGRPTAELSLVTLHLGNGCSAAAVRGGVSIDTTMGFTPLEGLAMGTRSGDIDAGALAYIARRLELSLDHIVEQLNNDSGLLGLSGLSNDMRVLERARSAGSVAAALTIDVFCYRSAKAIAAMSVPLGHLDAVVFTGGIGEHSVDARRAIMTHLAIFGMVEDPSANAAHGAQTNGRISAEGSAVALVVPTDEELVIARDTAELTAT